MPLDTSLCRQNKEISTCLLSNNYFPAASSAQRLSPNRGRRPRVDDFREFGEKLGTSLFIGDQKNLRFLFRRS